MGDTQSLDTCYRRAHLICVGAAKTGTHTIASMFHSDIRAFHEAGAKKIIELIITCATNEEKRHSILQAIRERDRLICAEIDSSQLNYYLLDILLNEYPEAKFLLTIRDCYTWLNSFINHTLRYPCSSLLWKRFRDYRFRSDQLDHPDEEVPLKERGLYTLEGYLSYWSKHNNDVLNIIPANRLMIVRTDQISLRSGEIAAFSGLPPDVIKHDRLHAFKNDIDFRVLHQLPAPYVDQMIEKYCGHLMNKLFPDIRCLDDAGI